MNDRALMADRLERFRGLTPRQKQVARLFGEGKTRYEVAAIVYRAPNTIKQHLTDIYRRLDINEEHGSSEFTKCRELARLLGYADGFADGFAAGQQQQRRVA